MTRSIFFAISMVATFAAAQTYAQPATNNGSPPPPPLTCADFQHNPDGSWTPIHPVTINGVTMGPGVSFNPGVSFGGVDLAVALNKQCTGH